MEALGGGGLFLMSEVPLQVIMSQSVAKLSSWLRLQLGYESSQALPPIPNPLHM